jgi:hypothetical protein
MTVIVDNTGFSVEHWSRFTEAEFIEANMRTAFKKHNEHDRRTLLQFAYQQIINDASRDAKAAKIIRASSGASGCGC